MSSVDDVRNSLLAIKATQKMSCEEEDIAKAFQLGLALGIGEKLQESEEEDIVTPQKAYKLGKLDALNEIKEEISNCIIHSPYFRMTRECCGVRDDIRQIFDKHIKKIEEESE